MPDDMGNENEGKIIIDAQGTVRRVKPPESEAEEKAPEEEGTVRDLVGKVGVAVAGGFVAEAFDTIQDAAERARVNREVHGWDKEYENDPFGNLTYGELRVVLATGQHEGRGLTAEELETARNSRRTRYREAASYGVMTGIEGTLRTKLVDAEWGDYPAQIAEAARAAEIEAVGRNEYRYNPRIQGVVNDAVSSTELLVRRDGYRGLTDLNNPKNVEKLRQLKIADINKEMEALEARIANEVLWDPEGGKYAGLVNQETPRQREERVEREKIAAQQQHELTLARAQTAARDQRPPAEGLFGGMTFEAYQEKRAAELRQLYLDDEEAGAATVPQNMADFLYGLKGDERDFWQLRTYLAAGRAKKQAAIDAEGLFPIPELAALRKDLLGVLMGAPGVSEATAIYSVLIARPDLTEPYLASMGLTDIRKVSSTAESRAFRKAIRTWFKNNLNLTESQARGAEQVAQGFVFSTNLPERMDYRMNKFYGGETKYGGEARERIRVAEFANLATRDVMYPMYKALNEVEKIEDGKGNRGKLTIKKPASRRVWPKNVLGEWLAGHLRDIDDIESGRVTALQKTCLFRSFFEWVSFEGVGKDGKLLVDNEGTMEGPLIDAGTALIKGEQKTYKLPWDKAELDRPFALYLAFQVSPARLIYQTLEEGSLPKDKGVEDIINVFANLGTVETSTRDTIFALIEAQIGKLPIDPRKGKFDIGTRNPVRRAGIMSRWRDMYPGFWTAGLPK